MYKEEKKLVSRKYFLSYSSLKKNMTANSDVESNSSENLSRPSNDPFPKPITLIDVEIQKTLSKLKIPKVLVLYTGSH